MFDCDCHTNTALPIRVLTTREPTLPSPTKLHLTVLVAPMPSIGHVEAQQEINQRICFDTGSLRLPPTVPPKALTSDCIVSLVCRVVDRSYKNTAHIL
jgi:hypothetical protein